jgi:hypothetical protein
MKLIAVSMLATFSTIAIDATCAAETDWTRVDQAIGKKGAIQPGGIYRVSLPRSDLKVSVDGVAIKPPFALGSWLAFQPMQNGAMVMGDLVLTDKEINPVMKRLVDGGLEVTAIHNHLLRASPSIFYMHVGGHGDPAELAGTLRAAIALSGTPFASQASTAPAPLDLNTQAIEAALAYKGTANGGVYQFSIPRAENITEDGMDVPPSMGTGIAINFQPTGGGKAAITGDFVLIDKEVNGVLKTLRDNGIEVTALHSHMVGEQPRLYFMHFWANDDAAKLAKGLRAALELTNHKPAS